MKETTDEENKNKELSLGDISEASLVQNQINDDEENMSDL